MSHSADVSFPLARSEGLLIEQVGDETVVLDTESKEAHCLSPLAAVVFAGADGRTRVEGIAELVSSDEPVSVEQVYAALAQLDERGLLDRPALPADPRSGISRRQLVRRSAGATAAISAVPLVTSIVTPAFAQAQTPLADCPRQMCASDSDGDDFCACNNECPPGPQAPCDQGSIDKCAKTREFNGSVSDCPYLDSCECLKCPSPDGEGDFSGKPALADALCAPLYGANYRTNPNRPSCASVQDGVGGCNDDSKTLDGVCARVEILSTGDIGDSSEPCPT
jgi:hypothetical protein